MQSGEKLMSEIPYRNAHDEYSQELERFKRLKFGHFLLFDTYENARKYFLTSRSARSVLMPLMFSERVR